jgi:NADH:ubiquinone oxidoreductase subunit F (NADH-binding)
MGIPLRQIVEEIGGGVPIAARLKQCKLVVLPVAVFLLGELDIPG